MKKTFVVLLMLHLPFALVSADETAPLVDEGKTVIMAFFGDLKGELVKGMKEGGPVHSIDVCHKIAPNLSEAHSQISGWQVARTSLKIRNLKNAPDAWELGVLQTFEARKAAGEEPEKLLFAEIVEENGGKVFRMMKAIPTAEICTACHGTEITPAVAAKLDELYPEDQARGFKVGDLRGAFTLKKTLPDSP